MSTESMPYPGSFGPLEDMGTLAAQFDTVVIEHFDALLADDKSLIDEELEITRPDLIGYANYLAEVLEGDDVDGEAHAASYRAVHFALLAASHMSDGPVSMHTGDFYSDAENVAAVRDKIYHDTQEYLDDKSELNNLIEYYLLELDASYAHGDLVTTVAALVFMHIDEHAKQAFIDGEVAAFSSDLPDAI